MPLPISLWVCANDQINLYERFDAKRLADWLPYRLDRPGMERLAQMDEALELATLIDGR